MTQQPLMSQDILTIEASRSHPETPHPVGILWTNDQPEAETSFYLTTHHNHKKQPSTHPAGFEPAIAASERPQTRALDRSATGKGNSLTN